MKTFDKATLLAEFDRVAADMAPRHAQPEPEPVLPAPQPVQALLYLPIEVKARELNSKAATAREALNAGFNVMLGATWAMRAMAPRMPPGIVLLKSTNRIDVRDMAMWRAAGHRVAVLDEEMFGIAASRDYLLATTHRHVALLADLVCAQGRAYAAAFPYRARLAVTGNPRVLGYREGTGDDILVCLQSGNINNNGRSFAEMVEATLALAPAGSDGLARWSAVLRDAVGQECDTLPLMMSIIPALAEAFPDRRIIVRPHPVEDPRTWQFAQRNVTVAAGGTIESALAAASVMIYVSGCTTGLDAYLAKIPAIRIGEGGHGISARMHTPARTPAEVIAAVRQRALWQGDISEHLAPVDLIGPLAALYQERPARGAPGSFPIAQVTPDDFILRKFPTTPPEEIAALIGCQVRQIAWNLFILTR